VRTDLWFDEDKINEENNKVVLHIFVCKALAMWTLCQTNTFAQRTIISFAVRGVEVFDWSAAGNAYWHGFTESTCSQVHSLAPTSLNDQRPTPDLDSSQSTTGGVGEVVPCISCCFGVLVHEVNTKPVAIYFVLA
jgi:hypothetical protein